MPLLSIIPKLNDSYAAVGDVFSHLRHLITDTTKGTEREDKEEFKPLTPPESVHKHGRIPTSEFITSANANAWEKRGKGKSGGPCSVCFARTGT